MTELLEKGKMFEWMPRREASFQELKKRLTTTLVLTMPDIEKPFSIYCEQGNCYLSSAQNLRSLIFYGYRIPKLLKWKWIQHWNKIFEKDNLRMPRFKKSKNRLRKIKLKDSVLMTKERYGTRSVFAF
jgi:hypothetical protein